MKALESPEMVQAFHSGRTLEIASAGEQQSDPYASGDQTNPTIRVHPVASPYTVMAGSILPAVLISGINSDLPGPILAQVSQNLRDSATGRSVLIPQGSRLIGAYQNASTYGQQRVQIAWQRLIFPNTSSMNLPMMPGADQSGYAGFSDPRLSSKVRLVRAGSLMAVQPKLRRRKCSEDFPEFLRRFAARGRTEFGG
jgi:type IV secretory pathway VirB10-like protein